MPTDCESACTAGCRAEGEAFAEEEEVKVDVNFELIAGNDYWMMKMHPDLCVYYYYDFALMVNGKGYLIE